MLQTITERMAEFMPVRTLLIRQLWTAPSAGSGTVYFYAAAFQNSSANSNGQSSSTKITSNETATGIESSITVPAVFALFQNYPNPFNPSTTIKFSIPSVETLHATSLQKVTLKIYDILGREIATLLDEEKSPGTSMLLIFLRGFIFINCRQVVLYL